MLQQAPSSSEEIFDIDYAAIHEEYAALEMTHLLGLPPEIQLYILQKLIPDPQFMSYFLNYAATARLPRSLIMDMSIWVQVANHWLKPKNLARLSHKTLAKTLQMISKAGRDHFLDLLDPKFEHLYKTNGMALVAAAYSLDQHSVEAFLNRLARTKYPYYIGEALKVVCDFDAPLLAKRLLKELLGKNPQGRDSQIRQAFQTALDKGHWSVMDELVKQPCTIDSGLLGQALFEAGKQNVPSTVKAIIQHRFNQLSFMSKWAVKSTPGFQASGLSVDDLFANQYWLVRTPLTICLHQIGYPNAQTARLNADLDETDTNAIAELLGNLSLEEQTPQQPDSAIESDPETERKLKL